MSTIDMSPYVLQLRQDILDLRYNHPSLWSTSINDIVETQSHIRTFQAFSRGERRFLGIQVHDADNYQREKYRLQDTAAHQALKAKLDEAIDPSSTLRIMLRAMAEEMVCHLANIGGRLQAQRDALWDLTCKRLHEDETFLQQITKEYNIKAKMTKVQHGVLVILEQIFPQKRKNPYHEQSLCDYAVSHQLADRLTGYDLLTVLDAFSRVLVFQDTGSVSNLLGPKILPAMNEQFVKPAQMTGLGPPDRRHITHKSWLSKWPDLDISQPGADPEHAIAHLSDYGCHSSVEDSAGH
jgi:hypothetical protein